MKFDEEDTILRREQNEIKKILQKTLPQYMIPRVFYHMKALPMNHNGKIDKKSLPIPNLNLPHFDSYEAPQNTNEKIIAQFFSEILGVDNIGTNDDFFQIGGNSLKAIHLSSELQKYYDIDVTKIFNYRTVKKIAHFLEKRHKIS